ncbi:MAG: HAMP domain-containing protein [Proteobacteria bacterium]|nr:HAMP domain-containing protein [Pseudomonadota bacterium]
MAAAIDTVVEIESRISTAIRWRGATETAVNMVVGGAVTTDAVLAQQYDARVKQIIGDINRLQEQIVASTRAPAEKAALDQVLTERKTVLAATAKAWDLKAAGDGVATQRFADDELMPMVARYLKAQDGFVEVLERERERVRAEASAKRVEYAIWGIVTSLLIVAGGLFVAWRLVHSIKDPLDQAVTLAEAIAAGDLTRELDSRRKDEFGDMLRALSAMAQRLRTVVTEVRSGVDSVSSASVQIANGNHDLSARTEQTASNLEETAASMEELTATVTQAADTARQSTPLCS